MKLYQGYCTNNDFDSHIELMNWNGGLVLVIMSHPLSLVLNEGIIFMITLRFIIKYVCQKFYSRQKILKKLLALLINCHRELYNVVYMH